MFIDDSHLVVDQGDHDGGSIVATGCCPCHGGVSGSCRVARSPRDRRRCSQAPRHRGRGSAAPGLSLWSLVWGSRFVAVFFSGGTRDPRATALVRVNVKSQSHSLCARFFDNSIRRLNSTVILTMTRSITAAPTRTSPVGRTEAKGDLSVVVGTCRMPSWARPDGSSTPACSPSSESWARARMVCALCVCVCVCINA